MSRAATRSALGLEGPVLWPHNNRLERGQRQEGDQLGDYDIHQGKYNSGLNQDGSKGGVERQSVSGYGNEERILFSPILE